jgi:predicted nucleotidyltransferase
MITYSRGETLLGYNFAALRRFTSAIASGSIPDNSTLDKLSISTKKDYQKVVDTLIDNGYIIDGENIVPTSRLFEYAISKYTITEKGREFCRAKCIKRMNRSQADALLNQILDRVKEVNNNPYYLYKVNKIVLFGSYISNKESLGDIDISFDFKFKGRVFETKNGLTSEINANQKRAYEKNCNNFIDTFEYAINEVAKFIRNRNPKIHITPYCHLKQLNTPMKELSF